MRTRRIPLMLFGGAVLLAGVITLAGAISDWVGYDVLDDLPFPWYLLVWAVAGLVAAVGGAMIVLRASARIKNSESLNIRAGS